MMLTMVGCGNVTNNDNSSVESEVGTEMGNVIVNGNTGEKEEVIETVEKSETVILYAEVTELILKSASTEEEVAQHLVVFEYKNENGEVQGFGHYYDVDTFKVGDVVKFELSSTNGVLDYENIISWEKVEN